MSVSLNLLVLRSEHPELLKKQYELLGLHFEYHKHGNSPYHYATEVNGLVLEIYPLLKSMTQADKSLRLGFTTPTLEEQLVSLKESDWIIVSAPKATPWGLTAIIQDLDGRKIELTENSS